LPFTQPYKYDGFKRIRFVYKVFGRIKGVLGSIDHKYMNLAKSLIRQDNVCFTMVQKKDATLSQAELVGFHKGSLATLAKEREEFMRLLQIVEQLMQMHVKELKDLGVDLAAEAKKQTKAPKKLKGKKAIEDVL
jgi:hypothetical protein